MVWGQARTVKLIEMYAQHRNLWDSKHEHFRCKVRKLDSIRHIARVLNSDPYEINKKLKTLLTQYRREKKIIDGGDPEKTKIPWFAYKHFGFLTDENWTPSTNQVAGEEEKKYENIYEDELEKWYDIEINENSQQSDLERDLSSNEAPSTTYVPTRSSNSNKDEIGVYTEVIAHTLRKISGKNPKRYCMLKHQIDNLLYEAEMELYENPNTQPQSVEILQVQLKTMKKLSSKPRSSSSSSKRPEKPKTVLADEKLSKSKHKYLNSSSGSKIEKSSSDQSKNKTKNSQIEKKSQKESKPKVEVDTKIVEEVENEYEDDFENYESDFEENEEEQVEEFETQDSEQKQHQVDLPTKPSEKIIQSVTLVEPKAVIKSHEIPKTDTGRSQPQKLLQPNPPISVTQTAHFDFKSAKQQLAYQKANSIIKKRWSYLKNVITLDSASSIQFSQPPIPYEVFMNLYGMTHMTQSYAQSGDDDVNEACETEFIETSERWTQFPPHINCKEELNSDDNKFTPKVKDWFRLAAFIRVASKTMLEAMEESRKDGWSEEMGSNAKNLVLHPPKFLRNSAIQKVAFAKHRPSLLLIAYNYFSNSSEMNRQFLLEWDTRWPTYPQSILSCFSHPNCCCLDASGKMAFAGMADGSVSVWDLEEHHSTNNKISFGSEEIIVKSPSYNTAEIMKASGPDSSIKAINCLEEGSAITQVVALEESAVFHIWIVLTSGESESSDLGMAPLGHLRLVKTYTVNLSDQCFSQSGFRVLDYVIHPHNSNTLLVATDSGFLFSTSLILNKKQRLFKHALELAVEVVSLCFLSDGDTFVCGFGDLTVQMFSEFKSKPVRVWHVNENIVNMCCSQSTIFVLGDRGEIVLWKLLDDDQKITKRKSTKHKSVLMDLIGINKTQLVIGYEGGIVEINQLIKNV